MKATKLSFLVFAASLISQSQLFAQATWIGSGTAGTPALWSDSANWTGTAPTNSATSSLTFLNSAANSFSTNDLTGLTVSSITVPANDGATVPANILDNTIGGNAITLTGNVTVSTGNWQRFNFDIDLGSAQRAFGINAGETFLGGTLSGAGASIRKNNGGTLNLSGNNSITGSPRLSIGNGRVNLLSTSPLGAASGTIFFDSGNNKTVAINSDTPINSYNISAGSSTVSDTVILGRATAGAAYVQDFGTMEYGARSLTFNQGANVTSGVMTASIGELKMTGGNDNQPVMFAGNATITLGSASITSSGISKRLQLDGTDPNNSVTGSISDTTNSTAGAILNLIKANSSTWTLAGNNSYTGTTTLNAGVLQLGSGGTTGALSTSSAITNNATLAFNRSDTITQGTDFASAVSGTGSFRKSAVGNLVLTGENLMTGVARDVLTFSGSNSGTVTLTNTAALGAAGNVIRFSGGGSGVLDLQTDTSVNAYSIASGTFNGGTLIANRASSGPTISHALNILELSSVTLTINQGSNVTGSAAVSFTELRMSGGNDFNPVTVAGDVDITIGSASITNNGFPKRLQLDGTSANNVVSGVISDTSNATAGAKVNLIKGNASTWKLQGNNTYTGDTTVSSGTLELDFPCLANASTVSVDGVLKLNHAATDVVGALYLGGVLQDPGVYHAGNSSPYITGSGSIEVLPASAYPSWAQTNITNIQPSADATSGGDPDGDGFTNLSEFAFRGNPLSGADNGIVRTFTEDSSDAGTDKELILTIAVRQTVPAAPAFSGIPLKLTVAGVTYSVEGSTDLTDFSAAVTEVTPVATGLPDLSADPDYEYRSFSLTSSNGLTGKGFLRAKVED